MLTFPLRRLMAKWLSGRNFDETSVFLFPSRCIIFSVST